MSITLELPKDLSEIYAQFAKENHTTKNLESLKTLVRGKALVGEFSGFWRYRIGNFG